MADCYRGVVIDGLETIFSNNAVNTLNALLKALNNRKYLYAVTLRLTYEALKERERKEMEEIGEFTDDPDNFSRFLSDCSKVTNDFYPQICTVLELQILRNGFQWSLLEEKKINLNGFAERQEKAAEEAEKQRLEEMDEEEYDALPDEERERIDRKRLEIKKDKLKR